MIPLKNVDAQIAFVPTGSSVSVTCSPAKGLQATLDLTAKVIDLGHMAVPHLSARLTEDKAHVQRLAEFCRGHGLNEVFLVAGDAPEPVGAYDGVVAFLRDFLDTDHGAAAASASPPTPTVTRSSTSRSCTRHCTPSRRCSPRPAVAGFASTQMCFDLDRWKKWATGRARRRVHAAAAPRGARRDRSRQAVDHGCPPRHRLIDALREEELRHARSSCSRPAGYDPNKLITPMSKVASELNIEGLHLFTFNNVEATAEWQRKQLTKLS